MINISITSQPKTLTVGTSVIVNGGTPPPGTVNVVDEDSNPLVSVSVPSGGTVPATIANGKVLRSDDTEIGEILAQGEFKVNDSEVVVQYENGDPISTTNVKATDAALIEVPNPPTLQATIDANTATDIGNAINAATNAAKSNDTFPVILPNVNNDTINAALSATQRNYLSNLNTIKTGITTSYLAGDDGDLEEGRGTDWLTLANGQPRFTVYGSYPNLFKDNLTGITWRNVFVGAKNDVDYYAEAASLTDGGLPAGSWKVPNAVQVESLLRRDSDPFNYAPINYSTAVSGTIRFVTSTPATIDPINNNQTYLLISTGLPASPGNFPRVGTTGGLSAKTMLYCTLETIV